MKTFNPKETPESKAKAKFRATSVWKKFRDRLKKERKIDFITEKNLIKGFQVHHCDMCLEHYKDLDESHYVTLNRTSHEVIHWGWRYSWPRLLLKLSIVYMKMDELNHHPRTGDEVKIINAYKDLISTYIDKAPEQTLLEF